MNYVRPRTQHPRVPGYCFKHVFVGHDGGTGMRMLVLHPHAAGTTYTSKNEALGRLVTFHGLSPSQREKGSAWIRQCEARGSSSPFLQAYACIHELRPPYVVVTGGGAAHTYQPFIKASFLSFFVGATHLRRELTVEWFTSALTH